MYLKQLLGRFFIACALLFACSSLFGQAGDYSFSVGNATYTPLGVTATNLSAIEADDASARIPIGFTFEFEGVPYTDVVASSNGFLSFDTLATTVAAFLDRTNDLDNGPADMRPLAAPLWDDLSGQGTASAANYEVSGTAPNRVFTMEWENSWWDFNASGSTVSFQVKLFETTNQIEYHYDYVDPSIVSAPSASIGLSGVGTFLSVFDTLPGTNPEVSDTLEYISIDTVVTNRVFTFAPPSCMAPVFGGFPFIGVDTVVFGWNDATGFPSAFEISYGLSGFDPTSSGTVVTSTNDTAGIGGLADDVEFDFYVRRDCGGGVFSSWSGPFTVATLPSCIAPTNGGFTFSSTDSIVFGWSSGTPAGPFVIEFGPFGFMQGTNSTNIVVSNNDTLGLGGLAPGTFYDFYVLLDCGAGDSSRWTGPFTVQTQCVPFTAPFTETFDGPGWVPGTGSANTGDALKVCWTRDAGSGYFWGVRTGTTVSTSTGPTNDFSGSGNYIYTEASSGSQDDTINFMSPEIDVSALAEPYLTFQYHMYGDDMGTLEVDVYDGSTWHIGVFTVSGEQQLSGGDPWLKAGVDLSLLNLASDTIMIRFVGIRGPDFNGDISIDEFSLDEAPPCPEPTGFTSAFVSTDSITMVWDSVHNAFDVEYGLQGFIPNTGQGTIISVTDTFAGIGGLTPNTVYHFYISADCSGTGGPSSVVIGPVTVTTNCAVFSAPFAENFDGPTWGSGTGGDNANDTIDNCWSKDPGSGYFWGTRTASTTSTGTGPDDDFNIGGNYIYTEGSSGGLGSTAFFETPAIDISSLSVPFLTFYYHKFGTVTGMGDLRIDVHDGNAWIDGVSTIDGRVQRANTDPWRKAEVNLDVLTLASDTIRIRFTGIRGNSFESDIAIDEVRVEEGPACPAPILDSLFNITPNSISIAWTSYNGATNFTYGPTGFMQSTTTTGSRVINQSGSPITISSLNQNSCYDLFINDTCAPNGVSIMIGPFNFCTPPTCPVPTDQEVDAASITLTSASISWTPGGSGADYNVEYGPAGFGGPGFGTYISTTSPSAALTNLNSGTEYEFYVRDSCGLGDVSFWTGPFSFITAFPTNYKEDFNAGVVPAFAWGEADAILTSNTVFTNTASSWEDANFGNSSGTTRAMRVNIWTTNQSEWVLTPSIYLDPAIPNLQAEFDAAVTVFADSVQGYLESDDSLAFVISTDNGASWSNANILWTVTEQDTIDSTGERIIVPLSAYSGYVRFGFYGKSSIEGGADNEFHIDNFEVRTPRACADPLNFEVTRIGQDSAFVDWDPGVVGAIDWSVIYTVGNQPAASGTLLTTTVDSLWLTGLSPSSGYCVYLVEQCANGFSDTLGPICFSTLCGGALTAPYAQDFDAVTTPDLPSCWAEIANNASTIQTVSSTADDHGVPIPSLPNALEMNDANPAIVISPEFSDLPTGLNRVRVKIAYEGGGSAFNDTLFFGVMPDQVTEASFVHYDTLLLGSTNGSFAEYIFDMDDVSLIDTNTFVAFSYKIAGGGFEFFFDDFHYEAIPTCAGPDNVAIGNIDCDSVEVSWTSGPFATSSYLVYGTQGFTFPTGGTLVPNVGSPYTINGLSLNTDYEVYIVDSCGLDTGMVGPIAFKTDSVGPVVAAFTFNQSDTTLVDATVDFDASTSTGGVSYTWDFGNGTTGTGVNASATYTANQQYTVKLIVEGDCGLVDSITQTIDVTDISLEENRFNARVSLYPNPSKGAFYLNVGNTSKLYEVEITDLSGRVVFRAVGLEPRVEHMIQLTQEAAGMYLLKIRGEGLQTNRRIILEK